MQIDFIENSLCFAAVLNRLLDIQNVRISLAHVVAKKSSEYEGVNRQAYGSTYWLDNLSSEWDRLAHWIERLVNGKEARLVDKMLSKWKTYFFK